jgi:hypothetical protein
VGQLSRFRTYLKWLPYKNASNYYAKSYGQGPQRRPRIAVQPRDKKDNFAIRCFAHFGFA